jgi:hypothetical protein
MINKIYISADYAIIRRYDGPCLFKQRHVFWVREKEIVLRDLYGDGKRSEMILFALKLGTRGKLGSFIV